MPIRKLNISCNGVVGETYIQYNMFNSYPDERRDSIVQKTVLDIKKKHGKNSVVRGMDLQQAGITLERNQQTGGHKNDG